jgi:hypothetical protein
MVSGPSPARAWRWRFGKSYFVTVGAEGWESGFAALDVGHFVASVINFIAGSADSRRYSGRSRGAITT